MEENQDGWRRTLVLLRWLVPVTMGGLGAGYVLWEHLVVGRGGLTAQAIREAVFLGTVGPLLSWLTLSWAVAAAEARARAKDELEKRNQELLFLNAVGETASQSLELQQVLDGALDEILDITGLEAGHIWVLDRPMLRLKSHRQVSAQFVEQEATIALGECLCGLAAQRTELLKMENLDGDSDMARPACVAEGFCAVMSVPVQARGRTVGVVHVASRSHRAFRPQEEQLLAAVGNQIGMAIENARLYGQARDFNQQLEQRVAERTEQLSRAREELFQKARQLQELLARTISIQEEERARIATDMHDGVTQLIVGAGYEIQAARERLAAEPEVAEAKLQTAQALLDRIEAEVRQAIYDLRPPILSSAGLISALKGLCSEFQALTGLPCLYRVTGDPLRLPAEVEVAVYRIVQQALHNVEAHAEAGTARVCLHFHAEGLRVVIKDDGRGFNPPDVLANNSRGLGLIGMQERAESIGGSLSMETSPGSGTRIILEIPIR